MLRWCRGINENGGGLRICSNIDMHDRRLLVIAEIGYGPPYMGNRKRMQTLLDECREAGYEIHFAGVRFSQLEKAATQPRVDRWVADFGDCDHRGRWERFAHRLMMRLRRLCSSRLRGGVGPGHENVDRWMAAHWVGEAKRLQRRERYKRVLVAYVFHSAFLEAFGRDCVKILDAHDVFAGRRERLAASGVSDYWFTTSASEERRALTRADVVIAIQGKEAEYFRGLLQGEREVREVGHFQKVGAVAPRALDDDFLRVGFLASDNPLNVDALQWFLASVWPEVSMRIPRARLLVGGRICGVLGDVANTVELVGEMAAVAEFYKRCLCTVNPMRVGTGLKIKTIESLAYGCPVVATPTGADGLEMCEGRGLVVTEESGAFVEVLTCWLGSPERVSVLGGAAMEVVKEINARWREMLAEALSGCAVRPNKGGGRGDEVGLEKT